MKRAGPCKLPSAHAARRKALNKENLMARANAIRLAATIVTVLITSQLASSQSSQAIKPDANGFVIATLDEVKAAGRSVTIVGDSSKPGIYVQRITWAPNTGSRPHFHNEARYITVIKGTWYVATGPASDTYNPDAMTPVKAGTFIYEPPNGHHYDMAKDEEVIVEIIGMGPVTTTSLEPGRGRGTPGH
jgi:quercetin dioxygenase-like cupin family protein